MLSFHVATTAEHDALSAAYFAWGFPSQTASEGIALAVRASGLTLVTLADLSSVGAGTYEAPAFLGNPGNAEVPLDVSELQVARGALVDPMDPRADGAARGTAVLVGPDTTTVWWDDATVQIETTLVGNPSALEAALVAGATEVIRIYWPDAPPSGPLVPPVETVFPPLPYGLITQLTGIPL